MPSNNNSSKNSSKMSNSISMSFGKDKNSMATTVLVFIIIAACVGYYYVYKSNHENSKYENFDGDSSNLTPASGEVIVALFYAPWCGHCKTFKPHFENAMTELNGKTSGKSELKGKIVRFAKIDCDEDQNKPLAKKYNVSGYPTVKILKDDGTDIEYDGERSLEGMKKFLVVDN